MYGPMQKAGKPPGQELRHRLRDNLLYLGDGHVSFKFEKIDHPNMLHKPSWVLWLPLRFVVFFNFNLYVILFF